MPARWLPHRNSCRGMLDATRMARVASLLGLLIAVLAGTLFAEYRSAYQENEAVSPGSSRQVPAASAGTPARQAGPIREWVDTILARPLFSPARRPPPGSDSAASGPRELARLTGVLVSRSEKRAIFASEGGKPIVAEEGTRIGAYVVQTIEPGQVTVIGPEGQRTLQPAYDPKARQAGQPAGPARAGPPRPVLENLGQPRVAQ